MDLRDFSEYSNEEYNEYMLEAEHPMCRSNIIPIKPARIMVFMPDVTKILIQEYINECKKEMIWIN